MSPEPVPCLADASVVTPIRSSPGGVPAGDRELREWVEQRWLLTASPQVRAAAATLTLEQRLVVGLGIFTDHRSGRIATVAGTSPGAVLGELRRAMEALRAAMNPLVPVGR